MNILIPRMYPVRFHFIRHHFIILILSVFAALNLQAAGLNIYSSSRCISHDLSATINRELAFFKVDTGGGILPLHNFSLTVTLKENTVSLKWLAENEMNTEKFVTQRSMDGRSFKDLTALPPAGPLNILTEYNAQDDIQGIANPVIYYRVKAEDNNGNFAYSNVVPVRLYKSSGFSVWPNPFTNSLNISYNAAAASSVAVELYDMSGSKAVQQQFSVNRGMNQLSVDGASRLSHGVYFVRVADLMTNEVTTSKIAK
jgi:hypothetical protein